MQKKKGETKNWKNIILGTVSKVLKDKLQDFIINFKEKVHHTMKVIVERIISSIIMIIGIVFLILAFTFYLIEYQQFTKTLAFLITAGALFLLSLVIRLYSKR